MNLERPGAILCFGEVLVRLSTRAGSTFSNAAEMTVHVGGAESNVAALLGQLGHDVEMITALPESALGDLCIADLKRHSVGTRHVVRSEGRLGLYFFERGGSGGRIIYDREHSVFAAEAGSFDWTQLASAARWFHLSGIDLAISGSAEPAVTAVSAMKDAGVPVSFDVNFRASLWAGKSEGELAPVRKVAAMADVLFAGSRDIARLLGGDEEEMSAAAASAFAAFDRLSVIGSTRRSFDESGQHLSARIDFRDSGFETDPAPIVNLIDRIGSGDAFAGAVIDQILQGGIPERCAATGLAAAVAKHGIAGDRWIGTRAELDAFDPYRPGDVRR